MARRNNSRSAFKQTPPSQEVPNPTGTATKPPETARPDPPTPSAAPSTAATTVAMAVAAARQTRAEPTREEITARAKALWEASGRKPGRDQQNWLAAERQLRKERGLL